LAARYSDENSPSSSGIQWKTAFEKTQSTGSGSVKSVRLAWIGTTPVTPSVSSRRRSWSTISAEASTA